MDEPHSYCGHWEYYVLRSITSFHLSFHYVAQMHCTNTTLDNDSHSRHTRMKPPHGKKRPSSLEMRIGRSGKKVELVKKDFVMIETKPREKSNLAFARRSLEEDLAADNGK